MTVVGSPFFLITISSSFATPLSDAQSSQDQSYRNRAIPRDGGGDERMPVPTALQQWPRIFPASNLDKGPGLQCG